MKNKICNTVATILLFLPWLIFPLRMFDWALESPVAEIMIYSDAALMICSGIFSLLAYTVGGVKNRWMQICLVVHLIYMVTAAGILVLSLASQYS